MEMGITEFLEFVCRAAVYSEKDGSNYKLKRVLNVLESLYRTYQVEDNEIALLVYPNGKDPNLRIKDTIEMFIADTTKTEKDFLLEL